MSAISKIKDSWQEFIKRSGEANREMFGDNTPDCCKMNNQTDKRKEQTANTSR